MRQHFYFIEIKFNKASGLGQGGTVAKDHPEQPEEADAKYSTQEILMKTLLPMEQHGDTSGGFKGI